jgi:hypothetical protein
MKADTESSIVMLRSVNQDGLKQNVQRLSTIW